MAETPLPVLPPKQISGEIELGEEVTNMKFKKTPVQSMIHNFVLSDYCYCLFKDNVAYDNKHVYFIALNSGALIERRIGIPEITDKAISSDFYVKLPYKVNPYFGVCNSDSKKLDVNKTRELFGMTCEELDEFLPIVSLVLFDTGPLRNYAFRGLRITSSYSENKCDLTDCWIPSDFPYITASEGSIVDHLSLYGFYKLIGMICGPYSPFAASLIEGGAKEETLTRIRQMWVPGKIVADPAVRPLPPAYYGE